MRLIVLLLATPALAAPLELRVLFGDRPAPPDTDVRLYEPSPLCGSAQRRMAPLRHPDATGRVTFDDIAPNAAIVAEHPALGSVTLSDVDRTKPIVLRFPAGTAIDGVVLDDRGKPAVGAHVALVPREPVEGGVVLESNVGTSHFAVRSLTTKGDGRFEFLGLRPGQYVVVAQDPGDVIGAATSLDVRGERLTAPTLQLRARTRVEGRVVDVDGKGVKARVVATLAPSAKLWPTRNTGPWVPAPVDELLEPGPPELNPRDWMLGLDTDDDGAFSLPLAVKGPVVLEAFADCVSTKGAVVKDRPVELKLPALATLEGRVLDPEGRPLASATVRFLGEAPECSKRTQVVPLSEGKFVLTGLPVGFTEVEVEAGGPVTRARVKLVVGKTSRLPDVKLGRGATLVGRVLGFEGRPLGGPAVTVGVRALDRAAENYPVRADGTFEVSGLTPGKVTVAAELEEGRASTLQRVVLVEGKRLELELRFAK